MSEEQSKISLPTELISEKTFYTLGGASAGVLLICWVINYVAIDVSWLNYKVYRLIGLALSETFAIIIMLKKKEDKSMRWLFAILNGFLIFVNASGLNVMTSGYIFNGRDTSKTASVNYFHFQKFHSDKAQQAGLFPLPRMTNWWPDEKLIKQNEALTKKNELLVTEKQNLQAAMDASGKEGLANLPLTDKTDSLTRLINTLNGQLTEKQTKIDELNNNANTQSNRSRQQLADCMKYRNSISDSLRACINQSRTFNERYENLRTKLDACNTEKQTLLAQLSDCNKQKTALTDQVKAFDTRTTTLTLTEHISQACNARITRHQPGYVKTQDDILKEQPFWKTFCASFNGWNTVIR